MSTEAIAVDLIGVGPMLMHCARLADPLDPLTKAIAAITSKRMKTEADHARIAELEWQGGLWLHNDLPCLPAHCIKAVVVAGAKKRNKGTLAKAAFLPDGPALVQYDGPDNLARLWGRHALSSPRDGPRAGSPHSSNTPMLSAMARTRGCDISAVHGESRRDRRILQTSRAAWSR